MKKLKLAEIEDRAKLFGKNLSQILDDLGMSQVELARRSGLTPAAVSQIINGEREPSFGTIVKILDVIPIQFEKLLKGGKRARQALEHGKEGE